MSAEQWTTLLTPVWDGRQPLETITREQPDGQSVVLAEGFEQTVTLTVGPTDGTAGGPTEPLAWTERRLVVRSLRQAETGAAALQERLTKAQAAILALNARRRGKPRLRDLPSLHQAVEAIVARFRVADLLQVTCHEQMQARPLRRYRDRPAGQQLDREVSVSVAVDQEAVTLAERRLGWRVYATNAPTTRALEQAVLAYREAHLIEGGFGRLKGRPLSLTPLFLQRGPEPAEGPCHRLDPSALDRFAPAHARPIRRPSRARGAGRDPGRALRRQPVPHHRPPDHRGPLGRLHLPHPHQHRHRPWLPPGPSLPALAPPTPHPRRTRGRPRPLRPLQWPFSPTSPENERTVS